MCAHTKLNDFSVYGRRFGVIRLNEKWKHIICNNIASLITRQVYVCGTFLIEL